MIFPTPPPDEISQVRNYDYDEQGYFIGKTRILHGEILETQSHSYDAQGRIIESEIGSEESGLTTTTYEYDDQDRLVSRHQDFIDSEGEILEDALVEIHE